MKLDEFLMARQIPFQVLYHEPAYTANRLAHALHVPGKEVAKTVLLRAGGHHLLAVLPATHRVDLAKLRERLGADVGLASEQEIEQLFPDCEMGAIPPFGSLYQMDTIVDESLAEDDQIVFEAHTHEEAVRMAFRDYEAVEQPFKTRFARHI